MTNLPGRGCTVYSQPAVYFFIHATIKGVQDIEVRPQVSKGFIVKLCVDEGATVKKGQALFQIDPTQYAAAERQAKAAVEMAKSNVNTLSLNEQQKKKFV